MSNDQDAEMPGSGSDPSVRKSRIVGFGGGGEPPSSSDDPGLHWREIVDPLGVPYFYNDKTKETTWTAPEDWVRAMRAKDPVKDRSKSIVRAEGDWQEKVDPASGRVYYITPDGRTQWERPESVFIEPSASEPESRQEDGPSVRKSRIVGFSGGDAASDGVSMELPPKLIDASVAPGCDAVGKVERASSFDTTTPELNERELQDSGASAPQVSEKYTSWGAPLDSGDVRSRSIDKSRIVDLGGFGDDDPSQSDAPTLRKSRIVGMGGGGDEDDAASPSQSDTPNARKSRIVGMGGGDDDDAESLLQSDAPGVRKSRIVGMGGGDIQESGSMAPLTPKGSSYSEAHSNKATPTSGPWRCPKCRKGNGARREKCAVCTTPRPLVDTAESVPSTVLEAPTPSRDRSQAVQMFDGGPG